MRTLSMSALGQKRTLRSVRRMSALPPKADIKSRIRDVRFVPSGHYYMVESMGLSWQQGPLSTGAIGRFLVPEPLLKSPRRLRAA
jgi:hypothetical protein